MSFRIDPLGDTQQTPGRVINCGLAQLDLEAGPLPVSSLDDRVGLKTE